MAVRLSYLPGDLGWTSNYWLDGGCAGKIGSEAVLVQEPWLIIRSLKTDGGCWRVGSESSIVQKPWRITLVTEARWRFGWRGCSEASIVQAILADHPFTGGGWRLAEELAVRRGFVPEDLS